MRIITNVDKYFDCAFVPGHLICRYYVAWPPEVELLLLSMIFISDHHMQCCSSIPILLWLHYAVIFSEPKNFLLSGQKN